MTRKMSISSLTMIIILSMVLSACGSNGSSASNGNDSGKSDVNLGQKEVTLAYVSWESAVASNNVMKQVLENVGYNVTIKQVSTGTMYAGVADGSVDATISSWLPTTDKSYWNRYKDQLNDIGTSLKKAPQGLYVPDYMDIDSVKDLANNKNNVGQKTGWTVTGIDAGAGEMQIIKDKMFPAYGLNDKWDLKASSSPAMLATVKKAIDDHKPIVAVLWQPHWAVSQWDMKLLKDSKDVFKKPDDIHTLARKGFKADAPAAYQILNQFHWEKKDMEKVMTMIHNDMEPKAAAKKWIKNNQDLVSEWTKDLK
ncbi:glycine betaine ABC transporter substrate-binding protein [Tuberibacillus sp. Marseille-P3662]|uniref:glycine betaine ABC transporter substrate-binding protein n=1 Tax=Tuberibacillus sp. Marseille-P3662 TaxID=1965358 RepID=UPI000A1C8114|nr:glycine betaine ABC transporter substrate-binding protein [Tuberibacillus sp. Marseille-P3662]